MSSPTPYRYAFDRRRFVREFNEAFHQNKRIEARRAARKVEDEQAAKRRKIREEVFDAALRQARPDKFGSIRVRMETDQKWREEINAVTDRILAGEDDLLERYLFVVRTGAGEVQP